MEQRAIDIRADKACEAVWLLQHPSLYTLGIRGEHGDFKADYAEKITHIEKIMTNRGGQTTYHGPGQLVIYVMMDLQKRNLDIRSYIMRLEQWIIGLLKHYDIEAHACRERVGLWVNNDIGGEDKIAAIGVRMKKWVSYHGIALNINPDLEMFKPIIPCGIHDEKYGVTSLATLGKNYALDAIIQQLQDIFLNEIAL